MSKHHFSQVLRVSFLSTILTLLIFIFMTVGANAHPLSASRMAGGNSATSGGGVTVNIVKKTKGYEFSVKSVTVTQGETATLCNKTSIQQSITYQGFTIYTIAANSCQSQTVNFSPGTYVVHLKSNHKASLTIIVQ